MLTTGYSFQHPFYILLLSAAVHFTVSNAIEIPQLIDSSDNLIFDKFYENQLIYSNYMKMGPGSSFLWTLLYNCTLSHTIQISDIQWSLVTEILRHAIYGSFLPMECHELGSWLQFQTCTDKTWPIHFMLEKSAIDRKFQRPKWPHSNTTMFVCLDTSAAGYASLNEQLHYIVATIDM